MKKSANVICQCEIEDLNRQLTLKKMTVVGEKGSGIGLNEVDLSGKLDSIEFKKGDKFDLAKMRVRLNEEVTVKINVWNGNAKDLQREKIPNMADVEVSGSLSTWERSDGKIEIQVNAKEIKIKK